MLRELRRNQNTLLITGVGMVALSLWSIIKTVLFIELDSQTFEALFVELLGEMYEKRLAVYAVFIFLAVDLLLRVYVGLRARKEGRGHKCGNFYLAVDAFFIVLSIYDIIYYFMPNSITVSVADSVVTVIFELTSLYTAASLFRAALKVRKLGKQIREGV